MALHQVGEAMITPTIRGPAAGTAGASAAAAGGATPSPSPSSSAFAPGNTSPAITDTFDQMWEHCEGESPPPGVGHMQGDHHYSEIGSPDESLGLSWVPY